MSDEFGFELLGRWGNARAGVLSTPHGKVRTPVFMPVGTRATVKSVSDEELIEMGAQIILGNTYHLFLRPGDELIRDLGGLHKFSLWSGPMLTDSGGYQVSSMGLFRNKGEKKLSKIDDDGVTFYSHIDGLKHRFTPEVAMQIQANLGADIIMAFDEATPQKGKHYARAAMQRTHDWLLRSKKEWERQESKKFNSNRLSQAMFGIVQGGDYEDLRRESAEAVVGMDLSGVAIGGASIGQSVEQTEKNMAWIRDILPVDKPRYLMGVGVGLAEVVEAIKSGADMFDCVAPTKLARSGLLYTGRLRIGGDGVESAVVESDFPKHRLNIGNRRFRRDKAVIDEGCDCFTCTRGYSRSYLRHLYKSRELLFYRLASLHNLRMVIRMVSKVREAILSRVEL